MNHPEVCPNPCPVCEQANHYADLETFAREFLMWYEGKHPAAAPNGGTGGTWLAYFAERAREALR